MAVRDVGVLAVMDTMWAVPVGVRWVSFASVGEVGVGDDRGDLERDKADVEIPR